MVCKASVALGMTLDGAAGLLGRLDHLPAQLGESGLGQAFGRAGDPHRSQHFTLWVADWSGNAVDTLITLGVVHGITLRHDAIAFLEQLGLARNGSHLC